MASEIKYAVQQFEWPTTTGTFDVTITSLGWTPKACKVTVLGSGVNGTAVVGAQLGVGFSDGTNQASVAVFDSDAVGTVDSGRTQSTSLIQRAATTGAKSLDFTAGTAGPIADGWKIDCINTLSAARKCIIEFFGGADLSAVVTSQTPAATGNSTKSGLAFTPNLVFCASHGSNVASTTNSQFSFGGAYDGVSIEQGGIAVESGHEGDAAQAATAKLMTASIAAKLVSGAETYRCSISSFTSDGWVFTVDAGTTSGNKDFHFLALDIGDRKAAVKEINAPTSAAADWAVTGIGFEPQGLSLLPGMMEAADVNALKTDQKAGYLSLAATDGTRQASHSCTVEDAAGTTNTARVSHTRTAYLLDTADAALFDVGLPTFESDGWTVAAADINTAQATQRKWLAIAIEAEATGAAFQADLTSGSFSVSPQDITVEAASERDLTTASFSFSALSIEQVTSHTVGLTSPGFGFTPLALETQADFLLEPTVSSFLFSPQEIGLIEPTEEDLTTGSFSFTAQDINYIVEFRASLSLETFNLVAQAIDLQADYQLDATTGVFNFTAQDILAGASAVFDLTSASFGFTATDLDYVADYTADLATQSFGMSPQSTEVEGAYEALLTTGSFSYTTNTLDVDTLPGVELGAANFSFMGLPLGGTIATGGAGARWIRSVSKVNIEQAVLRTQ